MPKNIDLSGQPSWQDHDRTILPTVEPDLLGIRRVVVGWIGRLRSGVEVYAPVADIDQGGTLELSQAQVRHLHAKFGELITKWDTEPRDLVDEVDRTLSSVPGRRFLSRTRASSGYEIETDGTAVHVYHSNRGERSNHLSAVYPYADALRDAGYTSVYVHEATDDHAARVVATPPAAEDL